MKLVIDRIEGEYAVCEDEGRIMRDIPLGKLPNGVKPGDCLSDETGIWEIDRKTAQITAERIKRKMDGLWKQ